jgi:hypothetical protein
MKVLEIGMNEMLPLMEEMLKNGKSISIRVKGTSMKPFLNSEKDLIEIAPITKGIKVNDICMFKTLNGFTVHRLINIVNDNFFFNGDSQTTLEGPIKKDDIIGVVKKIRKKSFSFGINNPIYIVLSNFWRITLPLRPKIINLYKRIKKWSR